MPPPAVVLVHGFASSFEYGWVRYGWPDALELAGRQVIGVDLLGHGTAAKPVDPAAYTDLDETLLESFPDEPVDAVGFSFGGQILLRVAARHPDRIRRLAVAGVGGRNMKVTNAGLMLAALRSASDPSYAVPAELSGHAEWGAVSNVATLIGRRAPNINSLIAWVQAGFSPLTVDELAQITCPVLMVTGRDDDIAGDPGPMAAPIPDVVVHEPSRLNHVATPSDVRVMDLVLDFLES